LLTCQRCSIRSGQNPSVIVRLVVQFQRSRERVGMVLIPAHNGTKADSFGIDFSSCCCAKSQLTFIHMNLTITVFGVLLSVSSLVVRKRHAYCV